MLRSVLAVVCGVAIGAVAVFLFESVGHALYPSAVPIDVKDPAQMRRLVAVTPLGAKAFVVIGWAAGAFLGGLAALTIARRWAPVAWVVAASILGLAATNFSTIPHPFWMQVGAIAGCGLGALGAIAILRGVYGPPPAAPRKPFS